MVDKKEIDDSGKKVERKVKIVTLGGAIFTGRITGRNENGIFVKPEDGENFSNSVFVSHRAISHLEDQGWQR
ncbi:MAG: hypothetical protein P8Y62_08130 [candidate division WOR-3 bacterium]